MLGSYTGVRAGEVIHKRLGMAREFIGICSPFISVDYASWLVAKARSGVEVWVLTSENREKRLRRHLEVLYKGRYRYRRNWLLIIVLTLGFGLLSSGLLAPIGFLIGWRRKKIAGSYPLSVKAIPDAKIHAKIYVVDRTFAAMGSLNYTSAGFWSNVESVVWYEGDSAKSLAEQFRKAWDDA